MELPPVAVAYQRVAIVHQWVNVTIQQVAVALLFVAKLIPQVSVAGQWAAVVIRQVAMAQLQASIVQLRVGNKCAGIGIGLPGMGVAGIPVAVMYQQVAIFNG